MQQRPKRLQNCKKGEQEGKKGESVTLTLVWRFHAVASNFCHDPGTFNVYWIIAIIKYYKRVRSQHFLKAKLLVAKRGETSWPHWSSPEKMCESQVKLKCQLPVLKYITIMIKLNNI